MDKIFVPNLQNCKCVVVSSESVLKCYTQTPTVGYSIPYIDYYYRSHYTYKMSSQTFNNNLQLPNCLSTSVLTDEVYYRSDFADIMIIFVLLSLVCFYFPWKILLRMFRRWQ